MTTSLEQSIRNKSATVGVIGLGYVGLPLIRAFVAAGFHTMGFDCDQSKISRLAAGKSYIKHIPAEWIARCVADGAFVPSADMARLSEPDALLICVPTPLNQSRDPDLVFIDQTARQIAKVLRPGQLVVLESTTYPGTTREVVLPILEPPAASRWERISSWPSAPSAKTPAIPTSRPSGFPRSSAASTPRAGGWPICSTARPWADRAGGQLRDRRGGQDRGKHLPLGQHRHGQRAEDALRPHRHRRLGSDRGGQQQALRLSGVLSRAGVGRPLHPHRPVLSELAGAASRHDDAFHRIGRRDQHVHAAVRNPSADGRAERASKPLRGSKVCVLGVAYKRDVDDARESPSFVLMDLLREGGAVVSYNDPHVPALPRTRQRGEQDMLSVPLTAEFVASQDCILIATDHTAYDYDFSSATPAWWSIPATRRAT